jgi:arylsulfatase
MEECSAAGPHTNWPLQKGFDRFYGFLQGETDQFHPELTYDNHPVDPPAGPDGGYHVSEDIVDQSVKWIGDLKAVRPDRPFFLYLAFGTRAASDTAEHRMRWRGKFDDGYGARTVLPPARQRVPGGTSSPPQPRGAAY